VSHLLEMLGRGLQQSLDDILGRYYRVVDLPDDEFAKAVEETVSKAEAQELAIALAKLNSSSAHQAQIMLAEYCRTHPDSIAGRCALAVACDELGNANAALTHLRVANELRPGQWDVLFAIGFCLDRQGGGVLQGRDFRRRERSGRPPAAIGHRRERRRFRSGH